MSKHLMTERHFQRIEMAERYSDLLPVAIDVIERLPGSIGMVCGPISTGGSGCIEENERCFNRAIAHLIGLGYTLFDQMVFEPKIKQLWLQAGAADSGEIFDHFYIPIFQSGRIERKFFMSNWYTSYGARKERVLAARYGIKIVDLDHNFNPIF